MAELRVRNVQEAYVRGLALLREGGSWEETRNGPALVYPEPVMTIYERPWERVLLDPQRNSNPYFSLQEAIWMLAGRRDVASIGRFNSGLQQYSDDGENYHGAYGWRWRRHFVMDDGQFLGQVSHLDQLARVIELLRANPADRRIVLTMWDPATDLGRDGLDVPCNTQVYFRTRRWHSGDSVGIQPGRPDVITPIYETLLDMTVTVRSNDAIYGAYGANAVHFSVLHEFVAAATGMRQGHMYQLSNNLHAYRDVLERVGEPTLPYHDKKPGSHRQSYYDAGLSAVPLFRDCQKESPSILLRALEAIWDGETCAESPLTKGGLTTIDLVRDSWERYKRGNRHHALAYAGEIPAPDWRRACMEWLLRRYEEKPR